MTNLLTIPHNIGRIIVEEGAMLCCGLLGTDHFVRCCRERGITDINRQRLIRLERLGLFAPVFRVRTPQEPTAPFHIPPSDDNNWFTKGWAEDTTAVPSSHVMPDHTDQDCQGYYSMFQINYLHRVLSSLTLHVQLDSYLDWPTDKSINWQEQGNQRIQCAKSDAMSLRDCQHPRAVALLCQHISNRYFPQTQTDMRTRKTGCESFFDDWITVNFSDWDWHREIEWWNPERLKRIEILYSLTPEKLRHAYEGLAIDQANCDPIEHWYPLTQFISVDMRKRLKGSALRSETMRNGAQMLRLLYKNLYGSDLPHPNEISTTIITPIPEPDVRKDTRRYLEFVANRFGVNPQPRLCLFVEGQSEKVAITRIFETYYGLHPGTCGIEVIDLGGVDNATGKKNDSITCPDCKHRITMDDPAIRNQAGSGGIIRLVDYLHDHHTVAFLILDNENRAKKFGKDLRNAQSIHNRGRLVTNGEYVKILTNSFEFKNFSDAEITDALTKLAEDKATFNSTEVAEIRENSNPGSTLNNLYERKVSHGLKNKKPQLAKILIDIMMSPESIQTIKDRPLIKILNEVTSLAVGNYLPIMQQARDTNQMSGFFGRRKTT
ncbi:MAG: hypothetical protein TH68_03160 [Candidatus Synechococcus spongiarum 142]|uniref:OLD protein-like TOPRIM domain-containing protein n=1 Tax=Candidatus Synechococcus spongiarum 142 TaxID=1608213 RepID=A0A6N3X9D0_9SYNE|nr:MAG: hypothetical protein TH68_03160 [Candidatus Synechococcus spongiarum 142]